MKNEHSRMKKLLFFGALLSMLCLGACGGGAKS